MGRIKKDPNSCLSCGKPVIKDVNQHLYKFCDRACQTEYKYNQYIERWKAGLEHGICHYTVSGYIRRFLFRKFDNKCAECGWSKTHPITGNIPLEVEHLDGNWKNNVEENLTLLCPCCHSLTSTHGSLNRGKGRKLNPR